MVCFCNEPCLPRRSRFLWTVAALAQQTPEATAPAAPAASALNTGDTAWMLTSVALVLMMTIPGLALFYGGMVRKMNVLATVMQSFAVTCLVTVLWTVVTYSMAFTPGSPFVGGMSRFLLMGMTPRFGQRSGQDDPRIRSICASDDLCDHHPGADLRRLRRPHEVLGAAVVHRIMGCLRLCADRPLGVGSDGFLNDAGVLDFRRRHGGARQFRRRRSDGCALVMGKRARLRHRADGAAQSGAQRDRRLAAVGRLVRLQRRLRRGSQQQCRHGDGGNPDRHRQRRRSPGCSPSGSSRASRASSASSRVPSPGWSRSPRHRVLSTRAAR
mgnify:CR=1 FL=1